MAGHRSNPQSFSGEGGVPYDTETFHRAELQAGVAELLRECCFQHAHRMAELICEEYILTPRRRLGHRYS